MRTTSKNLVIAAALAIGLLLASSTPASAAGSISAITVSGGDLSTVLGDFSLEPGSGGTAPCPDKADNLYLRLGKKQAGPPASGTWNVSGLASPATPGTFTGFFQIPGLTQWYQADFSILGNGTKTETAPGQWNLTGTINFQVRIYAVSAGSCAKTNLRCIITGRFAITSGTFDGTNPAAAGDYALIDAATNAPGGAALVTTSCTLPFLLANGSHATLDDLELTVL